jgi:hypothetical protein
LRIACRDFLASARWRTTGEAAGIGDPRHCSAVRGGFGQARSKLLEPAATKCCSDSRCRSAFGAAMRAKRALSSRCVFFSVYRRSAVCSGAPRARPPLTRAGGNSNRPKSNISAARCHSGRDAGSTTYSLVAANLVDSRAGSGRAGAGCENRACLIPPAWSPITRTTLSSENLRNRSPWPM